MREWRRRNYARVVAQERRRYHAHQVAGTTWRQKNRETVLEQRRKAYQEKDYRKYLKRAYGITPEDYDRMVQEQGGRCAVCLTNEPPTWKGRKHATWHVDHDHETGQVRGLLCFNCNAGIGHLKDSEVVVANALAYLRRTSKRADVA